MAVAAFIFSERQALWKIDNKIKSRIILSHCYSNQISQPVKLKGIKNLPKTDNTSKTTAKGMMMSISRPNINCSLQISIYLHIHLYCLFEFQFSCDLGRSNSNLADHPHHMNLITIKKNGCVVLFRLVIIYLISSMAY